MSVSPVANRSFLHGDRKQSSPASERMIYATIDSLALRRATLPLQLLPVDDKDADMTDEKDEQEESTIKRKSGSKIESTSQSSKPFTRPFVSRSTTELREMAGKLPDESSSEPQRWKRKPICSRNIDKNDIDTPAIRIETKTDKTTFHKTQSNTEYVERVSNLKCTISTSHESDICINIEEDSSNDYEKIEPPNKIENERDDTDFRRFANPFVKSKSAIDLSTNKFHETRLAVSNFSLSDRLSEEKLSNDPSYPNGNIVCGKKKRYFTKSMLNFVPEYLGKGSKKRDRVRDPLSSLKETSSTDWKRGWTLNHGYGWRSLSRCEPRFLNISSPTNFVHVASATNPSLVSNENTILGFDLERVLIMHEEKCATLPLLIGKNGASTPDDHSIDIKPEDTIIHRPSIIEKNNETVFDVAKLKQDLLVELQARSTKGKLESSQQEKPRECRVTLKEEKTTYEICPNSSFLWSDRSKGIPEIIDDVDDDYDDVGPVNITESQECHYDDVGITDSSKSNTENSITLSSTFHESDDVYDDVMSPIDAKKISPIGQKSADTCEMVSQNGEDDYMCVANEYSSVEEDETDEDYRDVYDDVGLPSEERVNSLYAGSTAGFVLGSAWTNGKESEWEDLEDSSVINGDIPCVSSKRNLSTETRAFASKKNYGRRRSRNLKRQRSKVSKKCQRDSRKSRIIDSAVLQVTVSLGGGTVLLVGSTQQIDEESWKRRERTERMLQQDDSKRTQGLVQMRVIDLDEDVDTQETSCYVHEENTSDDSTYESLHSFDPNEFSSGSDTEAVVVSSQDNSINNGKRVEMKQKNPESFEITYLEAPTRPNPPPPSRELSLTRTLGKRIKMLRRTWSITKGSLGRMRRRNSIEKNANGPLSTFYLNGSVDSDSCCDSTTSYKKSNNFMEPLYSNTSVETDHYSVLADQEPLYQFYAEAAAVVAYDSNSDAYDQVENTISSRSTTELVKPGHKTLWCQTPQVVKNELLQRLSPEEKRMQEAKFEILTSEASYLNSLRVLRNEFMNEPLFDEILTPTEKDKLFAGIPHVLHASEQFLAELETLWKQDPMLSDLHILLLKYADTWLDTYVPYCSHQVSIETALKNLRTRKGQKFDEIVSRIEARGACQSLSLHSFLMLPLQRITRLPLLADAVLSKLPIEHVDRSDWETVLSSLNYVVTECNEAARAAAKEMEMKNLARKLEYSPKIKAISLEGRYLVKSGTVVQLSSRTETEYKLTFGKRFVKTPLYLLLLTDYLLVTKYKPSTHDETYIVIDICKRSLIALESLHEDPPFAGRNAMLLTLLENHSEHQTEYILTCESDTERQRWLEAVSPTKRGLVEERLYESWDCPQVVALYCYSPNQPDELSLHPGDVINVFRKMSDGWYQGEKLLNSEQGWFPGNYTKEVASEHVRARNLKQRHRFLTLSGNLLQRKAKIASG